MSQAEAPFRRFFRFRNPDGSVAVEFALIAPVFFAFFIGIVVFGFIISTYATLQQIAAEAARAAISGLTTAQQTQYATQYVTNTIGNYPFIDSTQISVTTTTTSTTFQVTISYNTSKSFFNVFTSAISSSPVITRSATVQLSGF